MLLGYARVSTDQQDHALQLDALRAAGCDKVFVETGSGTRTDRPELAKVLEQARQDDVLVVWRLDRLARSLRHLIDIADDLNRRGVALKSITESIDTTTPSGRFMFNILGALSSMEREIIVERTRAGLIAAAARGPELVVVRRHWTPSRSGRRGRCSHLAVCRRSKWRSSLDAVASDVVSPCAGWSHRYCRESAAIRRSLRWWDTPNSLSAHLNSVASRSSRSWCMVPLCAGILSRFPPFTQPLDHCRLLGQHPIDACPTDPQPDGDFRGPDALGLQSDDLCRLSPRSRHTALVAPFALGLGDALPLALQHRLPLGLPDGGDHAQHEPAGGHGAGARC